MGRSTVGRVMLRLLDQIWPGHPDTWKGVRERLTPVIGIGVALPVPVPSAAAVRRVAQPAG